MKLGPMSLAGVVGFPVTHSLSPLLHRFWLREYSLPGAYVALATRRADFSKAMDGLRAAGFAGVNVTVPHKEAAYALCGQADETARLAGSVNLMLFRGGVFEGRNTDVEGLAASLEEGLGRGSLVGKTILILGAGGGARAAVFAAARLLAGEIRIASRNDTSAAALSTLLQPHIAARLAPVAWRDKIEFARHADLLVNATSAGMRGMVPLGMTVDSLAAHAAVCDIVYNPLETDLLRAAKARGLRTIDGLGMLMHQAIPAFEAFYGARPQVTAELRATLEQALADAA
jgi:shikimate dehydrogenase